MGTGSRPNFSQYVKAMAKVWGKDVLPDVKMPRRRLKPRAKETKPRKCVEATLLGKIKDDLKSMEFHDEIAWFDRFNAGKIQTIFGGWIMLCRKGTADLGIFCNDGRIWWVETKADGKHSEEQIAFCVRMERIGHKYALVKTYEHWLEIRKEIINASK